MYNIERIAPESYQHPAIIDYIESLNKHPYCSDSKGYSKIRCKSNAIKHAYIQPNDLTRVSYIVVDVDHRDATHEAMQGDTPPPHLIIQNPENAHAHLVYKLSSPVFMWGKARSKPIRYLARIERGLVSALGGDASYGGNLMKNPLHRKWHTYTTTAPQEGYSLEYLSQFVDIDADIDKITEASNDSGFGRNVSTFDHVRHYGYKHSPSDYNSLIAHLTPIATAYNQRFDVPMTEREVTHIVRSIARYCARVDFTASNEAFSQLQRERITQRWGDNTEKRKQAEIWHAQGMKKTVIAERLGVTARTLTNWGLRKK